MTVLAIDLAEDRIAVGVADDAGQVTHSKHVPSLPGTDPDTAFEALAALAAGVLGESDAAELGAIGVAVSGPRPSADGRVSPSALPSWVDYPLVSRLQDKHPSTPVRVHSQGDCFAMARIDSPHGSLKNAHLRSRPIATGINGPRMRATNRSITRCRCRREWRVWNRPRSGR